MSNERSAVAYGWAVRAALAAMDAPSGDEAKAAALVLEDVTDIDDVRRAAGALAWLVADWKMSPDPVKRRAALERLALEVAWRAS